MSRMRYLLTLLKGHTGKYISMCILVVFTGLLALVNPYLLKLISDDVMIKRELSILFPILLLIVLTTVIRSFTTYYYRMNFEVISQKIQFHLKNSGYKKIMDLDQDYFNTHRTGDIMTLMTGDIDLVRHFYSFILYNVIEGITTFTGAILMMIFGVNLFFGSFLLLIVPAIVIYALQYKKRMMPLFRISRQMRSKLNSVVQENISANRVVKAFVREDFENQKLKAANDDFRRALHNNNKEWRKFFPIISNSQNLFFIYSIVVGGYFVINDLFSIGELIMFNSLIHQITTPLNSIGWIVNDFSNCMASVEKIKDFFDTKAKITTSDDAVTKKTLIGNIEFLNVSFDYENEAALKDISFHVYKGQKIGMIGTTGSGKSSIINLMTRFYDCKRGKIYLDGVDIQKYDLDVIRNNIAIAHQDVFLFSETIAQNIAYGNPNATKEEIVAAAKMAEAHGFILKLENGYDTIVGERGVGLSGGQKQRIALARALIKKPSVLVLDDTTSSLDAQTEKFIQGELVKNLKDKTVFIISQRISSVKNCDLILVLDQGRIIERGTHQELIKNNGYYTQVFEHQFGRFQRKEGVQIG